MSASAGSLETGVRAIAPAKLNLALEVLRRRADGYHEIDTVMTTIDLADELRLRPHADLEVRYEGAFANAIEAGTDLVTRAARALAAAAGRKPQAHIEVTKRIPHPAGLGGGSSDAAAALRGLNALWGLDWPASRLAEVGAEIGSDVPFFVHGGNAHCTGRGETVEPLRDLPELRVLVLVPPVGVPRDGSSKTARRYAELRPADFSDGERSQRLAYRVARGAPPPARDLYNSFEAVIERTDFELMGHFAAYRAAGAPTLHLCGSGPAAFLFVSERARVAELRRQFREAGAEVFEARTLRRADAVRLEPLAPLDPSEG
jgi:4-diphosphocytidyl-2-C-methyl-D-erythritol kinase